MVASHPVAYFTALYRLLAQYPRIDLTVYYEADIEASRWFNPQINREIPGNPALLEGYPSVVFGKPRYHVLKPPFTPGCWKIAAPLWHGQYDAVLLQGYAYATNWIAMLAGRLRGAIILMREPPTLIEERSILKRLAKQVITRTALAFCYGLYVGTANRRFLEHYGVRRKDMALLPNAVDNDFFAARAQALAPRRQELRAQFGIAGDVPVILYCGSLVPWKQPMVMLEGYRRARAQRECALLVAGDGTMREEFEAAVAAQQVPDVHITGVLTQEGVCEAYAAADLLLLPSEREVWGLVINEAMLFGLPIVASDRVGAVPDLVIEDDNGVVYPHDDPQALAGALLSLVDDPARRARFGARSRELIEPWTIARGVENIVALIDNVREQHGAAVASRVGDA